MPSILVQGRSLEYVRLPAAHPRADAPPIVFLHEGLGSVAMWRNFPQHIADHTGCEAIVYSRQGYGGSAPLHTARDTRYMHDEALQVLPELLDALAIDRPILCGHSDGGSIALIHAGGCPRPVRGLILMAPHVLVEALTIRSIAAARVAFETTDLPQRLGKYHQDVAGTFWGWNRIWLHPDFRSWNIEAYLPAIAVPMLAIQGENDEYGTMTQIDRIAQLGRDVALLKLPNCRHSPHNDCPEAVTAAIAQFVSVLLEHPWPPLA